MKPCAVQFHPSQTGTITLYKVSTLQTFPSHLPRNSHLCYPISCQGITVPVLKSLLFFLPVSPECKGSDAGTSHMTQRSHKLPPLSEKVSTDNKTV